MSTTSNMNNCKDGVSIDDDVCELEEKLQNMSTADNGDVLVCANCGKEGDNINNTCNKCKMVKYCNAACKKKHRHKHKKDCEEHVRVAAERAAEVHDIELFKQPPPTEEDCPICFVRLPLLESGQIYMSCCGKIICSGCSYAPLYNDQGNKVDNDKCPFCRTPFPKSIEEENKRLKKRMEVGDAHAIYDIGIYYRDGIWGFDQDYLKALKLWHRAGELGHAKAYTNIGYSYYKGTGVEIDKMKSRHYYEEAAMKGCTYSRHNLGCIEKKAGNMDRALRHYMIAVRDGFAPSLNQIKELYVYGHATKDDYTTALQLYQEYLGEIKSAQRDKAATAREDHRY